MFDYALQIASSNTTGKGKARSCAADIGDTENGACNSDGKNTESRPKLRIESQRTISRFLSELMVDSSA